MTTSRPTPPSAAAGGWSAASTPSICVRRRDRVAACRGRRAGAQPQRLGLPPARRGGEVPVRDAVRVVVRKVRRQKSLRRISKGKSASTCSRRPSSRLAVGLRFSPGKGFTSKRGPPGFRPPRCMALRSSVSPATVAGLADLGDCLSLTCGAPFCYASIKEEGPERQDSPPGGRRPPTHANDRTSSPARSCPLR
jgi:hypothetical protein